MRDDVDIHYTGKSLIIDNIEKILKKSGIEPGRITASDLAAIDEFHIRGREATLELAERMNLKQGFNVLDIGSGMGGTARTIAEVYKCRVTGIDLTKAFCDAAKILSDWVGLEEMVEFKLGNATDLPFEDNHFDAALTIHAGMNIKNKTEMYREARRVIKPGRIFAVYDVLEGEGGDIIFPVPWARDPSISFLATPGEMKLLLTDAGLKILDTIDSTEESHTWFQSLSERIAKTGLTPITFQVFLGDDFPEMARNQVQNLIEHRIRTVSYFCEA